MRKIALTLGLLALASLANLGVARAQDVAPPKFGIGISNQLSMLGTQIGVPALPFSTLTAKTFLGDKMALQIDFGLTIASPETGDSSTALLFGGKFHFIVHRFTHSHFFVNAGFHFVNSTNPDALALNFGVNGGWEYIFPAGLPGLGISPEFGFNFTHYNPDGDGNNINGIQVNGYGAEFPYLLMNIRYYFL